MHFVDGAVVMVSAYLIQPMFDYSSTGLTRWYSTASDSYSRVSASKASIYNVVISFDRDAAVQAVQEHIVSVK